jgi:hypothetical protein
METEPEFSQRNHLAYVPTRMRCSRCGADTPKKNISYRNPQTGEQKNDKGLPACLIMIVGYFAGSSPHLGNTACSLEIRFHGIRAEWEDQTGKRITRRVKPADFPLAQAGWARPSSFLISQRPKTKKGACDRTRSSVTCT